MRFTFLIFFFYISLNLPAFAGVERCTRVNALIGDVSFISRFGFAPDDKTNEKLRIQTHLEFVEKLLRKKDVSHLTADQKEQRLRMLDLLNSYWHAGSFPSNDAYPSTRVSCFIDQQDRICAVGYLIEQTAGRAVAEEVNRNFKYKNILEMNDPVVEDWIAESGLTKLECALIQPTYSYENRQYHDELVLPDPVTEMLVRTVYTEKPVYIYLTDKQKENQLAAQVDSQTVVIDQLSLQVDSLGHVADSLVLVSDQKQAELVQLREDSRSKAATFRMIIWIMGASFAALFIVGLFKWFRPAKLV